MKPFNSTPTSTTPVDYYKALATLNDTEDGDEDCLLLDWSSFPDPLPPFILGTHVKRGEWTKKDTGEEAPTTPSHENNGTIPPPLPVIK